MPPAKSKVAQDGNGDAKSDGSTTREKAVAAAAHARKAKAALHAQQQVREQNNGAGTGGGVGGSRLRELALISTENGGVVERVTGAGGPGMSWPTAPLRLLNRYRVAHQLSTPACFTTPYRQAILTSPSGIGRRSPTMARRKDKRRVSRETLSTAVRKSFNAAAVSEIDVVVDLAYRVRFGDKAFRLRSGPGLPKKS